MEKQTFRGRPAEVGRALGLVDPGLVRADLQEPSRAANPEWWEGSYYYRCRNATSAAGPPPTGFS